MHAHAVDEYVDARTTVQQDAGCGAHGPQIAEIGGDDIEARSVSRGGLLADRLRLLPVAADHDQLGAAAGQALESLEADAGSAACDDADLAPHRSVGGLLDGPPVGDEHELIGKLAFHGAAPPYPKYLRMNPR
jgi:hypothetical protein